MRKGRIGLSIPGVGRDPDSAAEVTREIVRSAEMHGSARLSAIILHADEVHLVVDVLPEHVLDGSLGQVWLRGLAERLRDAASVGMTIAGLGGEAKIV